MFLAEEVNKRQNLKLKIKELVSYLVVLSSNETNEDSSKIDKTINMLFDLLDELQQNAILIDRVNGAVEVILGESKLLMSDAIRMRKNIKRKINVLTDLIDACRYNKNSLFDVFTLMDNREKLVDEFVILDNVVKSNDWKIKLGE